MRLFHYRLGALLDKARHREHAHQMELSRRERLLREAMERMERVSAAIEQAAGRLRALHAGMAGREPLPNEGALPLGFARDEPRAPTETAWQEAPRLRSGQARSCATRDVDMHRVAELAAEIERLRALLDHALRVRVAMERQVSDERQRLLEAARRRRMFEIHREGLALSHHRAEMATEMKQLDELATIRFANRAGGTPALPAGSAGEAQGSG